MVVCVCNALRECDIRLKARAGATTPGQAYRALGTRAKCGMCLDFARSVIDSERATA